MPDDAQHEGDQTPRRGADDDAASQESKKESTEEEILFARVEALKDKTRVSHKLPDVPDWNFQRPSSGPGSKPSGGLSDGGNQRSLGLGISVAYLMAGSVIVGFGLGWFIDRAAHSGTLWETILGLGGAVIGVVGTVSMIQRMSQK
jgi:hypothetical protein